jgi:hypothetical protein
MLPIPIEVGGAGPYDPAPGSSVVNIPSLAGQEFYLELVGYGTWDYSLWEPLESGGFELTSGTFVNPGEKYRIHVTSLASAPTAAGNYTNGFDKTRVMAALFGRLGWSQPLITGSPVINAANQESKSGRYFNDGSFHTLVTVANVKQTMEEAGANDANFNQHLTGLQRACIMRCLNKVFQEPEYLQEVLLFNRTGENDTPIQNEGKFVGFEISLAPDNNFSVQIESATLLFDQDVSFNLYLFKDGKKSPLTVLEVSAVAYESTVVNFSNLVLNYIGATTKGGRFYFGYFQDDLGSAQAIKEQVCRSEMTLCFRADPFSSQRKPGEYDFDRDARSYPFDPYGINLEMSVFRDFTNVIVKKAHLFDEVLGLTNAYIVIEQIIYAVRSNATERILKDQLEKVGIQLDLNGAAPISDSPRIKGLSQQIDAEFKRMRESFFLKGKTKTISLC